MSKFIKSGQSQKKPKKNRALGRDKGKPKFKGDRSHLVSREVRAEMDRNPQQHKSPHSARPKSERVAVGVHACIEALTVRPDDVREVWIEKGWRGNPDLQKIFDLAKSANVTIAEHDKSRLVPLAHSHQGVAVFLNGRPQIEVPGDDEPCLIVALDHVSDPHNLGAVLRSCWLTGVQGILVPRDRSVSLSPAAHKVASGGAEHVPVMEVTNLPQELEDLKKRGFWIYAFDAEAKSSIWNTKLADRCVLVIGSEDKGVRAATLKICDEKISLFQTSPTGCYNASVSASLAAFEWQRQRQ